MLFHTWPFLVFFLVTITVHFALRRTRLWVHWMLVASYFFYGWWNPPYLLLILWSTLLDWVVVVRMERSPGKRAKRAWLVASIASNLGLLGFFKYGGWAVDNLNALLELTGAGSDLIPRPGVLLPVGISFYTFQSMSYTIDFYRGEIDREKSFVRFATFVALFPQLVAGPIERARSLLPQLRRFPEVTRSDVADGASLFLVGLFKKVALANWLALYVDDVYANPAIQGAPALALATFAFAWQIYFDFSGYTDMARGVARVFGFRLMLNFNHPYLAIGLGDFWSRWHISLSTWFRDYVYIPLGGSRVSAGMMYRNIAITMIVSGLWHGAAWTFVVWGALHALGVLATRELERSRWYRDDVPRVVKQVLVFLFVCFTWIFFRARTLADAWAVLSGLLDLSSWSVDPHMPVVLLVLVLLVWVWQFLQESRARVVLGSAYVRVPLAIVLLLYLITFPQEGSQPFIYFQF